MADYDGQIVNEDDQIEVEDDENIAADPTPEVELEARRLKYGPFAGAVVEANLVNQTVTVDLNEKVLGEKNRLTYTTDTANAAMLIFNDLIPALAELTKKAKAL